MLRFIISFLILIATSIFVVYKLPADTKQKALESVYNVVPESVKEKIEPLILTPEERREKLIAKLENALGDLKQSVGQPVENIPPAAELVKKIEATETLVEKLKEINAEQSVAGKITTSVADKIADQVVPTKGKECACGE